MPIKKSWSFRSLPPPFKQRQAFYHPRGGIPPPPAQSYGSRFARDFRLHIGLCSDYGVCPCALETNFFVKFGQFCNGLTRFYGPEVTGSGFWTRFCDSIWHFEVFFFVTFVKMHTVKSNFEIVSGSQPGHFRLIKPGQFYLKFPKFSEKIGLNDWRASQIYNWHRN